MQLVDICKNSLQKLQELWSDLMMWLAQKKSWREELIKDFDQLTDRGGILINQLSYVASCCLSCVTDLIWMKIYLYCV